MVATTSSAFSTWPSWNFTFGPELEGPDGAVVVRLPGQREHGLQHEVGLVEDEELARLHEHHEAAGVGDGDRLDRAGGRGGGNTDGGVDLAGLCAGPARFHRAEQAAEHGQREAEPAAVAQQRAAVDAPGEELVDDVVLHVVRFAAQKIQDAGCMAHRFVLVGPA